jgi:hypothetical protein
LLLYAAAIEPDSIILRLFIIFLKIVWIQCVLIVDTKHRIRSVERHFLNNKRSRTGYHAFLANSQTAAFSHDLIGGKRSPAANGISASSGLG